MIHGDIIKQNSLKKDLEKSFDSFSLFVQRRLLIAYGGMVQRGWVIFLAVLAVALTSLQSQAQAFWDEGDTSILNEGMLHPGHHPGPHPPVPPPGSHPGPVPGPGPYPGPGPQPGYGYGHGPWSGYPGWHGGGPRPGWRYDWYWDPYLRPYWWYPGIFFPMFVWYYQSPFYWWQCTAFDYYRYGYSASAPTLNEAAYNALYDCGGFYYWNECYVPEGYCRLKY
ncbi:MAG: hypothetical protein BroJett040_23680 [Oligoflexia bacterium]|nr:MAG: hypothetical protein BroJett040_23680 [Oligoflexia bacterium]